MWWNMFQWHENRNNQCSSVAIMVSCLCSLKEKCHHCFSAYLSLKTVGWIKRGEWERVDDDCKELKWTYQLPLYSLALSLTSFHSLPATISGELEPPPRSSLRFPSPRSEWESRLLSYDRMARLGCCWNPNHEYHIWCVVLLNCFISRRT